MLDFGRYEGWSLGELVVHDPEYLEWLERMPIGRGRLKVGPYVHVVRRGLDLNLKEFGRDQRLTSFTVVLRDVASEAVDIPACSAEWPEEP